MTWEFYSELSKMWQWEEHWATLRVLRYRASHRILLYEFPEVPEMHREVKQTQSNQNDLGTSHYKVIIHRTAFSHTIRRARVFTEQMFQRRDKQWQLHDSSISSQPGGKTMKVKILWLFCQIWIGCFITLKKNKMSYNIPSFTRNKLIKGEIGQSS